MDGRGRYNNKRGARGRAVRRREPQGGRVKLSELLGKPVGNIDFMFLAIVVLLIVYGVIMLYSASGAQAYSEYGDSLWYLKNQLRGVVLGFFGMFIASRFDYHIITGRIAGGLYIFSMILLILVIAGLGTSSNGATRWLFGFQPSELAKLALIVIYAYKLGQPNASNELKSFKNGMLPYLILLGIYAGLIILEPHMSCVILLGLTAMTMLWFAGSPLKHFLGLIACAIPLVVVAIIKEPYRLARIVNFRDPFSDIRGGGYQIVQSLYSIGSGGIFGLGLGKSRQKFQSLPEPENDFIYSVLCEELGLVGAILLITLFMLLLIRGVKIALNAPDRFGTFLVLGLIAIVSFQALINIAVVTASIPVTGMPLPFFSYGSTALMITMTEMGVVLNVSRQSKLPI